MIVFIDESIHTVSGKGCACLAGLALREDVERHLSKQLFELKKTFWKISDPVEKELKGRNLLSRRSIRKPTNREFSRELLSLLREMGGVVFAILDEEERSTTSLLIKERGYLSKQPYYLLQRISQFMREFHPDQKAVLIFDGQEREQNKNVAQAISNFLFKTRDWKDFENIYSTPFFADSVSTPGVQLADFVAYCIGAHDCGRTDLNEFRNGLNEMRFKSGIINLDDEGREYVVTGIYKMRKGTGESSDSAAPPIR